MSKKNKPFKEDFLQFVWKFQIFDNQSISTSDGEDVIILKQGQQNAFSGPDFTNCQVRIGEELWAGNVEIHYSEKEWYEHKHHLDEAYNNVILHVVYLPSKEAVSSLNGIQIPTISLRDRIQKTTLQRYNTLIKQPGMFVPCANQLNEKLIEKVFPQYFNRLAVERLERKVKDLEEEVKVEKGSLNDAIVVQLFKYFGGTQNKNAFVLLARSLPEGQMIIQSMTSVQQLEALLFGIADMLHAQDEYAKNLENEFVYLKNKFRLKPLLRLSDWKFSGVTPCGFPTVRIAQLANFLFSIKDLFSLIVNVNPLNIYQSFESSTSIYWKKHIVFGKEHPTKNRELTKPFIERLVINVVVPFLFYYGKMQENQVLIEKSIDLLNECKVESNEIVKKWNKLGIKAHSALESQALLQLKTNYCVRKKCLECSLGYALMKQKNE